MKKTHAFKNLSNYKNCTHLITKKDSTQPYHFSLALHTNEEPNSIIKNRSTLKQFFGTMKFITANQTHSDNISVINQNHEQGWNNLEDAIENCDALISNQKNIMLTILTADCVPILLFDPQQQVIAAIHAGWKGTKLAIAFKTVKKMQAAFNCNPKDILAGIAPSIGKCCYEVDWNVAQHFEHIENAYDNKGEKQMLDLPHINKIQLLNAGLPTENIEMSNICTACEVDDYFSYRKESGCSGRFMSMIGLL
ncbi:peptidoglycan editing factor PgeF [bacterium]|nr:peptidoglycan editing factor PgeF [bacterium]MBU1956788.1 peptidoglycan editing factor PgeF [bacterium]